MVRREHYVPLRLNDRELAYIETVMDNLCLDTRSEALRYIIRFSKMIIDGGFIFPDPNRVIDSYEERGLIKRVKEGIPPQ